MSKLLAKVLYPLVARRDGLINLMPYVNNLEQSQYLPIDRVKEIQFYRLKKLLNHAYRHCSFYKQLFDQHGVTPEQIKDLNDLKRLPSLKKDDIRKNLDTMLSDQYKKDQLQRSSSGGTTGSLLWFYRNREAVVPKEAAIMRFEKWAGWKPGEWISIIWPAVMDLSSKIKLTSRVKNFISYRRLLLPMTEIHEQDIINHLKDIKKYRVNFIRSFPGPLTEVASYILSHSGNEFALQGVVTTGEILHDHQRKVIEKAFQCPVFDSYRTREVGPIAQECEHHRGLHINAEGVMVEIESIPDSGTENQNEGKILVTDLHNYAMPFIRYEIGDRGTLAKNVCGCGRGLPLLEKVGGRVMDVLYTTRGRRIASISVIPLLVANLGLTNQLQFVQQTLKKMVIRMSEPRPEVTILDKQQQIARKIFGEELEITYEFVPHIPLLASGKYRMTICEIPADQQVTLGN